MGFLSRISGILSPAQAREREAEAAFGTGLWRQHHDRFMRAVDRFYETALALSREAEQAQGGAGPGDGAPDSAGPGSDAPSRQSAVERIAALTAPLNDSAAAVTALTKTLHARWPVSDTVIPAAVRRACGPVPEKLSQAAAKAAEAGQAAAMVRIALRTGAPAAAPASAAERYVADACALVAECRQLIGT